MSDVAVVGDPGWVAARIGASRARYPGADARTLGTLWWYEASSALVGPVVETAVSGGPVADAGSVVLAVTPDGRVADARPRAVCADPGPRLRSVLASGIAAVASVSGAAERALWAIATDSIGNRTLWAGGTPAHAVAVAASVGADLPVPRFVVAGGRWVVRRASCCLIYQAGEAKCVSCPRQPPDVRARRLAG